MKINEDYNGLKFTCVCGRKYDTIDQLKKHYDASLKRENKYYNRKGKF